MQPADAESISASRIHHLVKTFVGWAEQQLPDGPGSYVSSAASKTPAEYEQLTSVTT